MTLLLSSGGVDVHHATHAELAEIVRDAGGCDAVIVDAPYSERTHAGHDDGALDAKRGADMAARLVARGGKTRGHRASLRPARTVAGYGVNPRRAIDYGAWSDADVATFVAMWAPLTRGWLVSITDHVLARAWEAALLEADRYTFAPLPLYSPGSRVRLSGDGPSSWTCHVVVARPRSREFFQWGTLPGGYVCSPERCMPVVGGKPLAAMRDIVRDYTRPGDLVVDPCCGAGTTLLAARLEGRRAIGGDAMEEHAQLAAERLRDLPAADKRGTLALFGGAR